MSHRIAAPHRDPPLTFRPPPGFGRRPLRPPATPQTVTDPAQHNQSYAPDFNKPNFFEEVEKRGLGDVLASGAASLRKGAERAAEE